MRSVIVRMKNKSTDLRVRLPALIFALEVMIVVLYAVFVTYEDDANALLQNNQTRPMENSLYQNYPFFADIQVMIFLGFGCLLAFFRRYGFGGMVFNFLIATFTIQWAILVQGFFQFYHDGKIHLGVLNLINAEFACAVVLISFGAVLGKTSPVQLLVSVLFFAAGGLKLDIESTKDVLPYFPLSDDCSTEKVQFKDVLNINNNLLSIFFHKK